MGGHKKKRHRHAVIVPGQWRAQHLGALLLLHTCVTVDEKKTNDRARQIFEQGPVSWMWGRSRKEEIFFFFFSSSSTLGPFVPRRVAHWLLRGSPSTFSSYIIKHYKKGGEEEDAPCDFSCASFVGWTTRRADDNWRVGEHEEGKEEEEGGDDTDGEARQLACVITGAACLATVFHDIPADHVQSTTPGVFRVRISMTLSESTFDPSRSWNRMKVEVPSRGSARPLQSHIRYRRFLSFSLWNFSSSDSKHTE